MVRQSWRTEALRVRGEEVVAAVEGHRHVPDRRTVLLQRHRQQTAGLQRTTRGDKWLGSKLEHRGLDHTGASTDRACDGAVLVPWWGAVCG